MTQSELAERVDLSIQFISYIENGSKHPSLETLLKIATALGTTMDVLLLGTQPRDRLTYQHEASEIFSNCDDKAQNFILHINNEKVVRESASNRFLQNIREDVFKFTRSKEVQQMLLADDIERINWYSNMNLSRREGRTEIVDLCKWLFSQNRDDDFKKATEDPAYLDTLLAEYGKAHGIS